MRYYVNANAQPTGEHEVHLANGCMFPAAPRNQVDLGEHPNCQSALRAAKQRYSNVDGCVHCTPSCHSR